MFIGNDSDFRRTANATTIGYLFSTLTWKFRENLVRFKAFFFFQAFSFNEEQWFAVLHNSDQRSFIQMYLREGRGLEKKQKIDLSGFSDMELITMKGIHYLVVASYNSKISQSISYQAAVT